MLVPTLNSIMINGIPNPHHELWARWCNLRNQCNNPNNYNWRYYGGRGIKYPRRWDDFPTFVQEVEDAIGPLPYKGAHLDRINNNGNYSPKNICWSNHRQNSNNKTNNHWVTYQGRRQTLAEWARETGIPFRTLWSRIVDYGLPPKQAFDKRRKNAK